MGRFYVTRVPLRLSDAYGFIGLHPDDPSTRDGIYLGELAPGTILYCDQLRLSGPSPATGLRGGTLFYKLVSDPPHEALLPYAFKGRIPVGGLPEPGIPLYRLTATEVRLLTPTEVAAAELERPEPISRFAGQDRSKYLGRETSQAIRRRFDGTRTYRPASAGEVAGGERVRGRRCLTSCGSSLQIDPRPLDPSSITPKVETEPPDRFIRR